MSNIRKCEVCGNVITVVYDAGIPIDCCGQPMKTEIAKTGDEGLEKHKPALEKVEGGVKVKVGSIEHPMGDDHYIMLIQLLKDGKVIAGRQLSPTDAPEAFFAIEGDNFKARAYCNLHGLWESD